MQQSGFHAMSVQSVADEARVSVGLIYQYFGNKEDLLRGVVVDMLEDFRDEIPRPSPWPGTILWTAWRPRFGPAAGLSTPNEQQSI